MNAAVPADPGVTSPPAGFPRILPHLIYEDVGAAITWLTEVFGFEERTAARHLPRRGVSSMLRPPETQAYGDRSYEVTDPEGHRWTFAQHLHAPDFH
ncbi:MAG TPA: hypothetical protein VGN54_02985 [Mycobacteriales bacterium]|nr:hypothetical protein [Mycobacteriales bacterium]